MAYSPTGNEPDYYAVLTVTPTADEETIRQAYRRLAREYHPDVAGEAGAEPMKRINAAYQVLSDPIKRHAYDARYHFAAPQASAAAMPSRGPRSRPAGPPPTPHITRTEGPFQLYRQLETHDSALTVVTFAQGDAIVGLGFSDGRVEIWHLATAQCVARLHTGAEQTTRAGVLQEIRLSPSGALAMAWGLNLGTAVWECGSGQMLWSAAINGPSGSVDGILLDSPAMVRLVTPAAPLAMAEDDPFHWAELGRFGSDVWTRPLTGSVSPAWAVPLHCEEPAPPQANQGRHWRVHLRALSWDGEWLLTFATGPASANISNASMAHLWNLRQHGRLGTAGPQLQGSLVIPARALWYPLAVSATAMILATQFENRALRLYNIYSGQHIELPTGPVPPESRLAISADGALLALAHPEQRRVELWATASGQRIQVWDLGAPTAALSFAATGGKPTLAIAMRDGTCAVWATG